MTEAQWITWHHPTAILDKAGEKTTARKLRLFACACCRQIWELFGQEARAAVEATERFIEGRASKAEVDTARTAAFTASLRDVSVWYGPIPLALNAETVAGWHPAVAVAFPKATSLRRFGWMAYYAADFAARAVRDSGTSAMTLTGEQAQREQAALARCLLGNPFRPATFSPSWRTDTALMLARQMYDSREFGAMPILADALQDAGCANDDILNHCRGDGPHVRGCWVVDLVLGKE
jgi:hypothetical protein